MSVATRLDHAAKLFLDGVLSGQTLKIALSTAAVDVTASLLSGIAEVAAGNGYTAGGYAVTATVTEANGAAKAVITQPTITASGSPIVYRSYYLYRTGDGKLIAAWDENESVSVTPGTPRTLALDQTLGAIGIG